MFCLLLLLKRREGGIQTRGWWWSFIVCGDIFVSGITFFFWIRNTAYTVCQANWNAVFFSLKWINTQENQNSFGLQSFGLQSELAREVGSTVGKTLLCYSERDTLSSDDLSIFELFVSSLFFSLIYFFVLFGSFHRYIFSLCNLVFF